MHKPQRSVSELTLDPRYQRQPLPPPHSVNPFVMQYLLELLQANTIPWCEDFYGSPFCGGPVYQEMAQQNQHQYRAPSPGPSRNQRSKGSRKTEAQYLYNNLHESSGTIAGDDRSTGIHPDHARIGASNNTGAGKVWRTPSRDPLMADHNSTQQTKPYNRDRSNRTRRSRTDKVDPSVYEIPIVESKGMLISLSILIINHFHQQLFAGGGAMAGGPKIPTPVPAMLSRSTWRTPPAPSTVYMETTRNTNKRQKRTCD